MSGSLSLTNTGIRCWYCTSSTGDDGVGFNKSPRTGRLVHDGANRYGKYLGWVGNWFRMDLLVIGMKLKKMVIRKLYCGQRNLLGVSTRWISRADYSLCRKVTRMLE